MGADGSTGAGAHGDGSAGGVVWRGGARAEPSDVELVTRVRDGDTEAFAVLYRRHEPAASRVAGRIVDPATAQDGDAIGDCQYFPQLMADENDRLTLFAQ